MLNGSSISYGNRNYTLVEDIQEHQVDHHDHQDDFQEEQVDHHDHQDDIQEDQVDHHDHQDDIQEEQVDIQDDHQEEDSRTTTEEAVEKTEASLVQEKMRSDNLNSSIIIGCSAVVVVSLVALILVILYHAHSKDDPDLGVRRLTGEMLQPNFQVKLLLKFLVLN